MSSLEGRAGNEDFGSLSVDDHDFTAFLTAVVMLLSKHGPVARQRLDQLDKFLKIFSEEMFRPGSGSHFSLTRHISHYQQLSTSPWSTLLERMYVV